VGKPIAIDRRSGNLVQTGALDVGPGLDRGALRGSLELG
jgi:hypothetical protein